MTINRPALVQRLDLQKQVSPIQHRRLTFVRSSDNGHHHLKNLENAKTKTRKEKKKYPSVYASIRIIITVHAWHMPKSVMFVIPPRRINTTCITRVPSITPSRAVAHAPRHGSLSAVIIDGRCTRPWIIRWWRM